MATGIEILKVIHIVNAILMAWPFYALVAVNQRVRLGPPVGDRVDTYMENIIKNRTVQIDALFAQAGRYPLMWQHASARCACVANAWRLSACS